MPEIKIACAGADTIDIADLRPLQDNLKALGEDQYQKLKTEILETGFAFPLAVWKDPQEDCVWIIGGHQRHRVLTRLREKEDFIVPKLPVVFIEAKDIKEAHLRVLQDVSQYGNIDRQGLYEFMNKAELEMKALEEKFQLPDIDMESFKFEYFEEPNVPNLTDADALPGFRAEDKHKNEASANAYLNNNIKQIVLFYENSRFEEVLEKANALVQKWDCEDFSELFIELLDRQIEIDE
jgi:hypothetical protein